MKKINLLFASVLLGCLNNANACSDCNDSLSWGFSGSLGLTQYSDVYNNDGQSVIGRLSLNGQYALSDFFSLGIEAGVQNGNSMRLDIPQESLDLLGGEPVSVVIKPMLDLLVSMQVTPFEDIGIFGFMKGGMAYRQLQVNRNEVNNVSKITPELQAGLGYKINDYLAIHMEYQQVFGGDPYYQVNELSQTATIANIPTQKAVMLGLTLII